MPVTDPAEAQAAGWPTVDHGAASTQRAAADLPALRTLARATLDDEVTHAEWCGYLRRKPAITEDCNCGAIRANASHREDAADELATAVLAAFPEEPEAPTTDADLLAALAEHSTLPPGPLGPMPTDTARWVLGLARHRLAEASADLSLAERAERLDGFTGAGHARTRYVEVAGHVTAIENATALALGENGPPTPPHHHDDHPDVVCTMPECRAHVVAALVGEG